MRVDDLSKANTESNSPFLYSSYVDESKPIGYETSDLKEMYLSREQLSARMVSPAITQEDLIQHNKALVKSQIR
jgi:dimeric dUTPase (all-alpha-NTP-PPase superfamily)